MLVVTREELQAYNKAKENGETKGLEEFVLELRKPKPKGK